MNIHHINDQLSPELRRVEAELVNRAPMMQKLGEELAKALRQHFTRRDKKPNAKGWPKRHFWNKEGRENTALTHYNQSSATVTIASAAIGHKLKGMKTSAFPNRRDGRLPSIPGTEDLSDKEGYLVHC